jgi:chorismate mutase
MDTQRDYAAFRAVLDELCAAWDRPPAKDELVASYWRVLKEYNLTEIRSNATRLLATASRETRWPKPGDLIDVRAHATTGAQDAAFAAIIARNIANWEEMRRENPAAWRARLGLAHIARICVTESESSPQYAEARRLELIYKSQLRELGLCDLR